MLRIVAVLTIAFAVFGLLFAAVPSALATQIIYRTPQEMGEQSSLVVQGKVVGVRSFWNEKAFKGPNTGTVRVLQLGGTVGSIKVTVAGALQWRTGEEVLLFLEEATADTYLVSGFSQGKFNIVRDPATGEAFVRRPALEGAEVLGAPPSGQEVSTSAVVNMPLRQFVDDALNRR
jgi:hypothetical protein